MSLQDKFLVSCHIHNFRWRLAGTVNEDIKADVTAASISISVFMESAVSLFHRISGSNLPILTACHEECLWLKFVWMQGPRNSLGTAK